MASLSTGSGIGFSDFFYCSTKNAFLPSFSSRGGVCSLESKGERDASFSSSVLYLWIPNPSNGIRALGPVLLL
jgi:hypothetical protein